MNSISSGVSDAIQSAIEFALAHPVPAAFGVVWTLFCAAMLYAFLSTDSRPEMVSRQISEADAAREVTR